MVLSFILATMFISAIYTILYLNYLTARHKQELRSPAEPQGRNQSQVLAEVDSQMLVEAF